MTELPGGQRLSRRHALGLAAATAVGGPSLLAVGEAAAASPASQPDQPTQAGSPAQGLTGQLAPLDAAIREAMAGSGIPGVAVGVLYQGQEYVAGYGVTNVDAPQTVDADTLFQIGSISKTFTMAALMQQVEQGRLDLDTPIRQYVPDLRLSNQDYAARISLHHLLTHTSGLPADDFSAFGGGDDALARYATGLGNFPFVLPPGEWFSYSNIGISLAGRVLEVARDQPYEQAIRELLLEPLGMTRATFFADEAILYPTAAGHTLIDDKAQRQRPWALPRTANAAGGLTASAREMLRYAHLWLNQGVAPNGQRLLRPETLARIESRQSGQPDDLINCGLVWSLADVGGTRFMAHDGGTAGQNARLWIVPERGFAVCILTNANDGSAVLGTVGGWLVQNLLGLAMPVPGESTPLPRDAAMLAAHAAVYTNPGEASYIVRVQDGGLAMDTRLLDPYFLSVVPQAPPDPTLQLVFASPTLVHVADAPSRRGAFLPGPDGRPQGLFWGGRFYRREG